MKYNAHRGLSSKAPENTLAAFELVKKETHYRAIECDVYTSKDAQFVIFHDAYLLRMTGHQGKVMETHYEVLKKLPIITGNGIEMYPDEHIPLLEEFLEICIKNQKIAQIEIKEVHQMTQLVTLIDLLFKHPELKAEIISFNLNYLKYIRALSDMPLKMLVVKLTNEIIYECRVHELDVGISHDIATPARIKNLKKQGLKVLVFTVDDYHQAIELEQMGVDEITTNVL